MSFVYLQRRAGKSPGALVRDDVTNLKSVVVCKSVIFYLSSLSFGGGGVNYIKGIVLDVVDVGGFIGAVIVG